jgi:uncharacterized protein
MFDTLTIAAIFGTFLLAGSVKGVVGLGLPTVSLGLLTATFGLPTAMALLLVPSFGTNLWQAFVGGNGRAILLRIWPFLLMATATVWLGATALIHIDHLLLSALLGLLIVAYSIASLSDFHLMLTPRQEAWLGPLLGTANGILTGMTGSFIVPGVMFLQAIGLPRDSLIQAMGMLFTASTLALAIALQGNNFLTAELGLLSAIALIPAIAGMAIGQRIRRSIPEAVFRRVFFVALLILGAYLITDAAFAIN